MHELFMELSQSLAVRQLSEWAGFDVLPLAVAATVLIGWAVGKRCCKKVASAFRGDHVAVRPEIAAIASSIDADDGWESTDNGRCIRKLGRGEEAARCDESNRPVHLAGCGWIDTNWKEARLVASAVGRWRKRRDNYTLAEALAVWRQKGV